MRVLWMLMLTGCLVDSGLYEERQREICHPEAGCTDRPWWPDADGDGWGDPGSDPVMAPRQPEVGTANNLLDCDDGDSNITAGLFELCPTGFGAVTSVAGGSAEADLGSGTEPVEWLVVEITDGLLLHEAADRCELGWGGVLGAPRSAVESSAMIWVSGLSGDLHPSWGTPTVESPTFWTGTELAAASAETQASVACMRAVPDPADWETFEVPQ